MKIRTSVSILLIAFAGTALSASDQMLAVATFVKGKVMLEREGKQIKVKVKTIINKDDKVITGKGIVDIQVGKGAIVRLTDNSVLEMRELYESGDVTKVFLQLQQGRAYNKIAKAVPAGGYYRVGTPTAVAGVRGTEFLVSENTGDAADKKIPDSKVESGVYVNEGTVAYEKADDPKSRVDVVAKEQVLNTTNELKKQILDDFVARKMEIFKKLELMKEANYEMLKKQKEASQQAIDRIKQQNKDLQEKMKN